jgi:hypothetical protein
MVLQHFTVLACSSSMLQLLICGLADSVAAVPLLHGLVCSSSTDECPTAPDCTALLTVLAASNTMLTMHVVVHCRHADMLLKVNAG